MTGPTKPETRSRATALVIGGGPAGLMAAEALADAGVQVTLYEAMPTLGRKFLMAGKSGLNLTKAEDPASFIAQYGSAANRLAPLIQSFGPAQVTAWAEDLGQSLFTGSTGRVFPRAMKASPLLRAWIARLNAKGVTLATRARWLGFDGAGHRIATAAEGPFTRAADVTVFALGGASWRRLGSDGTWASAFGTAGIATAPFQASNAGITLDWPEAIEPYVGQPLKNIRLTAGTHSSRGECVISATGLEGGGIYPLTPALRSGAPLTLDTQPDQSLEALTQRLAKQSPRLSTSNLLRRATKLSPAARSLVRAFAKPPRAPEELARHLKAIAIPYTGLQPLDAAISTAGGVAWEAVTEDLMLIARPGTYVAGEMLDWEAPTGGYLLTACLASGRWAGRAAAAAALGAGSGVGSDSG